MLMMEAPGVLRRTMPRATACATSHGPDIHRRESSSRAKQLTNQQCYYPLARFTKKYIMLMMEAPSRAPPPAPPAPELWQNKSIVTVKVIITVLSFTCAREGCTPPNDSPLLSFTLLQSGLPK
jgi:hypothetical protein